MTIQDILKDYPSVVELSVAWGEMDAAQHVNNIVYLRYSEIGRISYFEKAGFRVNTTKGEDNIGPILAEISCKYKYPVTYPDKIYVATRILNDSFDEYSFHAEQLIISHKAERIAAEVRSKLVCYDYHLLKKVAIPLELKERFIRGNL